MMSRTTQNVCITMPPDIVDHIDSAARAESRTRSQQVSHILTAWLQITGETRLADLERVASAHLSDDNTDRSKTMATTPTNPKQGTPLDKTLPGHGSTPLKDVFSPAPRPVAESRNDSDVKFAPRFPRPSGG
jgi:hypothetical protein